MGKNLLSEKVAQCIEDFSLIGQNEKVLVAYSGGKDSLVLCKVLKDLGYDVRPYIIDIGYNADWSKAIYNAEKYAGTPCQVIDMKYIKQNLSEIVPEVEKFFGMVGQVYAKQGKIATTICTPCYNAKYVILRALSEKLGIKKIAFGHHGTDAVSSLLKSFFMFKDRFEKNHTTFRLENLYKIVDENKQLFADMKGFSQLKPKLQALLKAEKISTNEPPRQTGNGLTIIRPFFYCREEEIKGEMAKMDFVPVNSECSFLYRKNLVETSREYIQFHLVNFLGDEVFESLIGLIKPTLTKTGENKFDARKNRDKILGESYKNDGICSEKL